MHTFLEIKNGITRHPAYRMAEAVSLKINKGEQVAFVGDNAAGKSRLIDILTGRWPLTEDVLHYNFRNKTSSLLSDNIKYISFRDSYGDSDMSFYQQRWNSTAMDDTPLVSELIPVIENEELKDKLFTIFGLSELMDKPIITLSSGELRKFQLTKALLSHPELLILDNPFIGLDAPTRDLLHHLLKDIIDEFNIQIFLILAKSDDIPEFITHIIPVAKLRNEEKIKREEFSQNFAINSGTLLSEQKKKMIGELPAKMASSLSNEIVKLNQVCIKYGDRTILKALDWVINSGEKWALSGENGAGKSTLLSLVCADNPQSYACDIELFGRKRGTGESIWDIKREIGYVSPEMHRSYKKNIPAIEIVASGLYDTVGLYRTMKEEDRDKCLLWMKVFGIDSLADKLFLQLSSGEQRMVLLARAFVKDPSLLILDEPFHGLDLKNRKMVKEIIEEFCKRENKTLIMITHYEEELPRCITNRLHLTKNQ